MSPSTCTDWSRVKAASATASACSEVMVARGELRAFLRRSGSGREPAALLSGGWASSGDAAGDGVDRGPPDHGLGGLGVAFVVAGQAAVGGEPGEGPLDRPGRGITANPCWPAGLRTTCTVVAARIVAAQSTSRPANPPSA